MADSTEVIQQQMDETRHRLAENLDKLSQQTAGAVAATFVAAIFVCAGTRATAR